MQRARLCKIVVCIFRDKSEKGSHYFIQNDLESL